MRFFNEEKKAGRYVLIINLTMIFAAVAILALYESWFIYHGDLNMDVMISVRSAAMPFLMVSIFFVLFNVSYLARSYMRQTKGFLAIYFTLILPLIAGAYWLFLSSDKALRDYALSIVAPEKMYACKMYIKGRGRGATIIYYYAADDDLCGELINQAPDKRKDFDKAIAAQKEINENNELR